MTLDTVQINILETMCLPIGKMVPPELESLQKSQRGIILKN